MKNFIKGIFKKDKNREDAEESPAQKSAPASTTQKKKILCTETRHRQPEFPCSQDHCQNKICTNCLVKQESGDFICNMCMMSIEMLGDGGTGMDFNSSSDEEEFKSGGGMQKVASVTIDKRTSQVVGWDSIWAIINAEDEEREKMEQSQQKGLINFLKYNNEKEDDSKVPIQETPAVEGQETPKAIDPQDAVNPMGGIIDGNIHAFADFTAVQGEMPGDVILEHKTDPTKSIRVRVEEQDGGKV